MGAICYVELCSQLKEVQEPAASHIYHSYVKYYTYSMYNYLIVGNH